MKPFISIILSLFLFPTLSFATLITLSTGDKINAEIIEQTDAYLKINHKDLGELTITKNNILSIGSDVLPQSPIAQVNVVEDKDDGLFGIGILPNWERSFTLGLNGKEGNSQVFDIHTAFDADYKDDYKRWDFGIYYSFSQKEGDDTQDDLKINLTRDWLLPNSQWLYFASGKFDWDKFKSWDYRLTGIVGVGYEFFEEENLSLIGRTGIAGKKNYGSDDDNFVPELMIGLDTDWTINKIQSLAFKTEFFTPFEQASDFRNLSRLDWKFKLDSLMDLSFKIGLENEYESKVDSGTKHNDFKYRAAIVWGL